MTAPSREVSTRVHQDFAAGDASAAARLMPLVYDELRALAAAYLARESTRRTLQPTMLVHEAYLRMVDHSHIQWADRKHFMAVAATQMRRILIDHARSRRAAKRGGGLERVALGNVPVRDGDVDLIDLDDVLSKLAEKDEALYRIVELRFFSGMTMREVAEVLNMSVPTVERHWRLARAWLSLALSNAAS